MMRVQVEIIGGAQFDQQLVQAGAEEMDRMGRGERVSLGEFTVTVPEGADYSFHMDREIEMRGNENWNMESEVEKRQDGQQQTFHLKGRRAQGADVVERRGDYEGRQVAVIEFH